MKINSENQNKHFFAVSLLSVLGNTIITAPEKEIENFNFAVFLISEIFAVIVCYFTFFMPFNKITAIVILVLSFYCTAETFTGFVGFVYNDLLTEAYPFLIIVPFVIIIVFAARCKIEVFLKFSLVCLLPAIAIILFFFCATLSDFNIKNIFVLKFSNMGEILKQFFSVLKSIVFPGILAVFFAKDENTAEKSVLSGLFGGYILLGAVILNSVLLFGTDLAVALDYPYSSAGSTVTFGILFTRMDGVLYFLYFVTCFVKCVAGIFLIKKSIKLLRQPNKLFKFDYKS